MYMSFVDAPHKCIYEASGDSNLINTRVIIFSVVI